MAIATFSFAKGEKTRCLVWDASLKGDLRLVYRYIGRSVTTPWESHHLVCRARLVRISSSAPKLYATFEALLQVYMHR